MNPTGLNAKLDLKSCYSGRSFERPHLNPNKNGLPNEVVFHQRRVELCKSGLYYAVHKISCLVPIFTRKKCVYYFSTSSHRDIFSPMNHSPSNMRTFPLPGAHYCGEIPFQSRSSYRLCDVHVGYLIYRALVDGL